MNENQYTDMPAVIRQTLERAQKLLLSAHVSTGLIWERADVVTAIAAALAAAPKEQQAVKAEDVNWPDSSITKIYEVVAYVDEQQDASVPVCEKWAVYYDNKLAGTDYQSGFVEGLGVNLYDSEKDAREIFSRREDGGIGYRVVKVFVYTAPPAQAESVPDGLLERVKSAEQRIASGHCIHRIPADPTDPDLVLADVRMWLEGKPQPSWIAAAPEAPKS